METKERRTFRPEEKTRCDACGEEYSVTYKKCPFCGTKPGAGGKRLSGGRRLPVNDSPVKKTMERVEPVRVIGLVLSLILIAAAVYILVTALGPLFRKGAPAPISSVSEQSSVSASESESASGSADGQISVSAGDSSIITPVVHAIDIRFDTTDVTLRAGESFTPKVTLIPSECDDEIVWSSSNEAVATVSGGGTVTNVNAGASSVSVTITATAGDVSAACTVRCAPGVAGTPAVPAAPAAPTGSAAAVNQTGRVTGTTTGLLVRSGPGREHEAQDTLTNDAEVTVLEDTGTGWYKISYSGSSGKAVTGYASKDYIQIK